MSAVSVFPVVDTQKQSIAQAVNGLELAVSRPPSPEFPSAVSGYTAGLAGVAQLVEHQLPKSTRRGAEQVLPRFQAVLKA